MPPENAAEQIFVPHLSIVLERDGKILLVKEGKKKNYGKWNFPGGHLEKGERFKDAACREVLEETNLKIKVNSLIGVYTSWRKKHYLQYVYSGEVISGNLSPQEGEILDCHWFEYSEIESMDRTLILYPRKMKRILDDFRAGKGVGPDFICENY